MRPIIVSREQFDRIYISWVLLHALRKSCKENCDERSTKKTKEKHPESFGSMSCPDGRFDDSPVSRHVFVLSSNLPIANKECM
jgi:hypothetical protein